MNRSFYYDRETGGVCYCESDNPIKREPRPVYADELTRLGFDKFWEYDQQNDVPYMWHDLGRYYYRGEYVACVRFNEETLNFDILEHRPDMELEPIDLAGMVDKNYDVFETFRRETIEKLQETYDAHSKDFWYVAYSGGKDSQVLLNVVIDALYITPRKFEVYFNDTTMEFPQTYKAIDETKELLGRLGVPFHVAKNRMDALETWRRFTPPSRKQRWCCSVHKSASNALAIKQRGIMRGVVMTGVRKVESITRSTYEYYADSKNVGWRDCRVILDWTAVDVWNEIYSRGLYVNELYKKGAARVGCLLCPMSSSKADALAIAIAPDAVKPYIERIARYAKIRYTPKKKTLDGWRARTSGALVEGVEQLVRDEKTDDEQVIKYAAPNQDLGEWLKTLGPVEKTLNGWRARTNGALVEVKPVPVSDGLFQWEIRLPITHTKDNLRLRNKLLNLIRRSVYCINCGVCAANCTQGAISYDSDVLTIDENKCVHCGKCTSAHNGQGGQCLRWHNLFVPNNREEIIERSIRKNYESDRQNKKDDSYPLLQRLREEVK